MEKPRDYFDIPGSSMGMLYRLESPAFEPTDYGPLSFAAVGSGAAARDALDAYDLLFAVDHPSRAVLWFIDALSGFLLETQDQTVGGLLLVAALRDGSVKAIGYEDDPDGRKAPVGIALKAGRFVARSAEGREVVLKYPAELLSQPASGPLVLDDHRTISSSEAARRASLRARLDPAWSPTKK
jgi:hypothetical protein